MLARVGVAVVAVVLLGWLAVLERDTRLQARAAGHGSSPAALARAADDLRAARLLNPDSTPDVARAVVYRTAGRDARAAATVEAVVRREPDNLLAWGLVRLFAGDDPAAVRRALAARARLDPLSARRAR